MFSICLCTAAEVQATILRLRATEFHDSREKCEAKTTLSNSARKCRTALARGQARFEDRPAGSRDQPLQRERPQLRIAAIVEPRRPDRDRRAARRDREDAAPHARLARQAHAEGEFARAVIMAAGEHQRVDAAGAVRQVAEYLGVTLDPAAAIAVPEVRKQDEGESLRWAARYAEGRRG